MPRRRVLVPGLLAGIAALALAGCAYFATDINTIKEAPEKYLGQDVTIAGVVQDAVSLPLLPAVYAVRDSTGVMYVLTKAQPPTVGSRVRIRGRVAAAIMLRELNVGMHLKELDRY
jgi:hypothetical protein